MYYGNMTDDELRKLDKALLTVEDETAYVYECYLRFTKTLSSGCVMNLVCPECGEDFFEDLNDYHLP